MFGVDLVSVVISSLVEAFVFTCRLISVGLSIASAVQTNKIVKEVNQPVSHLQPTPPSADSTALGEQLPTEWQ
ncbi:MAG: hypothetical protein HY259_11720 [Chloroflexi bacterium]|nr:hypothetical protein [Chloroflexota bacterium]